LNVTYKWVFSTVFAFAFFGRLLYVLMLRQGFFGGLLKW
jgi:hypothetical protein